MKCVILAAGEGSRLRSLAESKPLAPVAGVPLIEHVVTAAASVGLADFIVVTGYRGEAVEAFLGGLAARLGVGIAPVRVTDWKRPNGLSLADGAAGIDGDFLLTMADHLFDSAILRRLLDADAAGGLRLAVDRDVANPRIDIDDATKVATDRDGAILRIGKSLEDYDAIDTGLFRATPALREAVLEAVAAGRSGSLSDGVQRLADRRQAGTLEIGGAWWLDVDDPASHALAEAHLAERRPIRDSAA